MLHFNDNFIYDIPTFLKRHGCFIRIRLPKKPFFSQKNAPLDPICASFRPLHVSSVRVSDRSVADMPNQKNGGNAKKNGGNKNNQEIPKEGRR